MNQRLPMRVLVAGVVWIAGILLGFNFLWSYESAPGNVASAPPSWPQDSTVAVHSSRPVLLFFAHPKCPCTRASLAELEVIAARCHNQVDIHAMFFMPPDHPDWATSDLVSHAQRIPGVQVSFDAELVEASRFGASTSGHVLVYSSDGALQFSGGITSTRGHAGDNFGRSKAIAAIQGKLTQWASAPVFGCALTDDSPAAEAAP